MGDRLQPRGQAALVHRPECGRQPAIGTIDPATKRITEFSAGLNVGSHPEGIDVAPGGNLWFTDDNDPNPALGTIDRVSHEIHEYSKGLRPGSLPRGISAGPGGSSGSPMNGRARRTTAPRMRPATA